MVYCDVCQAFVQIARQTAGKALGAAAAALFGIGPATPEEFRYYTHHPVMLPVLISVS